MPSVLGRLQREGVHFGTWLIGHLRLKLPVAFHDKALVINRIVSRIFIVLNTVAAGRMRRNERISPR